MAEPREDGMPFRPRVVEMMLHLRVGETIYIDDVRPHKRPGGYLGRAAQIEHRRFGERRWVLLDQDTLEVKRVLAITRLPDEPNETTK